jgi:heptosyltransferase-2
MNLVLFLPNWLGDLVMATPALRAIRRRFGPQTHIVGVVRPHLAGVLEGTTWLDELWLFDPHDPRPELRRLGIVREMRRQQVDIAVLLTNSLYTGLMAWLGRARQRIGYVRYGRGPLLTGKLHPPRVNGRIAPSPMVGYYLKLAQAVGAAPESSRLELATTAADELSADRVWESLGLRPDGRVVLLNAGGAYGPAKRWPLARLAELSRRIAGELDHDALILCGPREREMAREALRLADHPRVFSMADQALEMGTVKACIRRGRLMVTTDSGPLHIATAFGVPVIALYGPTLQAWTANPTAAVENLQLDLECIGCQRRVCPLGHNRCMSELGIDRVLAKVVGLLDRATKPSGYPGGAGEWGMEVPLPPVEIRD